MALTIGINASLKDLLAGGKSLVILLAITIPLSALDRDAVAQPYRWCAPSFSIGWTPC
ncbi:MAG: hypothetical protein KJN79_12010 [Gammaproteobacteria bacterium]|nr:hypothetical protein [Gammaproteobacteria bacterium]